MYQCQTRSRPSGAEPCWVAHVNLEEAFDSSDFFSRWSGLPRAVKNTMQHGVMSGTFSSELAAKNAAAAHMLAVLIPSYELPELQGAV